MRAFCAMSSPGGAICVIGAGEFGLALARRCVRHGKEVRIATRSWQDRAQSAEPGLQRCFGPLSRAAEHATCIVLAIPAIAALRLAELAPGLGEGNVIVDPTSRSDVAIAKIADLPGESDAVRLARRLPYGRVVKAFNTLSAADLDAECAHPVLIATDDEHALKVVFSFVNDLALTPVDAGMLCHAQTLEELPLAKRFRALRGVSPVPAGVGLAGGSQADAASVGTLVSHSVSRRQSKPLAVEHHARMLRDAERLTRFRQVLDRLDVNERLVDLGCGTGILTYYGARRVAKVHGIEYAEAAARVARELLVNAGVSNAEIIQKRSYDVTLDDSPTVLVSETIGALGPEEGMVEAMYDFCRRHPTIERCIPSSLDLFAVPVKAPIVNGLKQNLHDCFYSATSGRFDYRAAAKQIDEGIAAAVLNTDLSGSELLPSAACLAHFELGVDASSSFEASVRCNPEMTAMHLYFVARLDGTTQLTSSLAGHPTHWGHVFLPYLTGARTLRVAFTGEDGLVCQWDEAIEGPSGERSQVMTTTPDGVG
jgi:predicted dinucleotide-binding enzyme/SAM-dependent methyltransferase